LDELRKIDEKVSSFRIPSLFGRKEAIFKARVLKGGRITIPETERKHLELGDGDLVRVILSKITD